MMTIKINDDEIEFDGGTMITIQTKDDDDDDDEASGDDDDDDDDDQDQDQDEYHENAFSPNSPSPITNGTNNGDHEKTGSAMTAMTNISADTNATNITNPGVYRDEMEKKRKEKERKEKEERERREREQSRPKLIGGGGGYSIGSKKKPALTDLNSNSFDGNTMVRQASTDDEEEDPFQGQTMYRAPTIDSPRANLISDDYGLVNSNSVKRGNDNNDNDDNDNNEEEDDESVIISPPSPDSPEQPIPSQPSPPKQPIGKAAKGNAMSDDEEEYNLNTGYENKPRAPLSPEPSFVC